MTTQGRDGLEVEARAAFQRLSMKENVTVLTDHLF